MLATALHNNRSTSLNILPIAVISATIAILPSAYDANLADPSQSTKTISFLGITIILVFTGLIQPIFLKSLKLRPGATDIAFLAMFGFLILNRYLFRGTGTGISMQVVELICLVIFYYILRLYSKTQMIYFAISILSGGLLQEIHGLTQLWQLTISGNKNISLTGSFINSGPYAGFLAVTGILAVGFYFYRNELIKLLRSAGYSQMYQDKVPTFLIRVLPQIHLFILIILLPALRSRAAWTAFLIGLTIILIQRFNIVRLLLSLSHIRKWAIIISLFACIAIGFNSQYHFKKASADGRVLIYAVSLNILSQNLLRGVGYDRFQSHYMNAQADWLAQKASSDEAILADNVYYAFNEPLQFLVENGTLGVLVLAAFIIVLIKTPGSSTEDIPMKSIIYATLAGLLIFGLFSYPSYILPLKLIGTILVAWLVNISTVTNSNFVTIFSLRRTNFTIGIACLIAAGCGCGLYYTYKLKDAFSDWHQAELLYHKGFITESLPKFSDAYPMLSNNGDYLMQFGKSLSMAGRHGQAIEILNKAKEQINTTVIETSLGESYKAEMNFEAAEQAYLNAANMAPGRFYPIYLLALLYDVSGDKIRARDKANELLNKEVKVHSTAIMEMKSRMRDLIKTEDNESRYSAEY